MQNANRAMGSFVGQYEAVKEHVTGTNANFISKAIARWGEMTVDALEKEKAILQGIVAYWNLAAEELERTISRFHGTTQPQKEELRRAILTNVLGRAKRQHQGPDSEDRSPLEVQQQQEIRRLQAQVRQLQQEKVVGAPGQPGQLTFKSGGPATSETSLPGPYSGGFPASGTEGPTYSRTSLPHPSTASLPGTTQQGSTSRSGVYSQAQLRDQPVFGHPSQHEAAPYGTLPGPPTPVAGSAYGSGTGYRSTGSVVHLPPPTLGHHGDFAGTISGPSRETEWQPELPSHTPDDVMLSPAGWQQPREDTHAPGKETPRATSSGTGNEPPATPSGEGFRASLRRTGSRLGIGHIRDAFRPNPLKSPAPGETSEQEIVGKGKEKEKSTARRIVDVGRRVVSGDLMTAALGKKRAVQESPTPGSRSQVAPAATGADETLRPSRQEPAAETSTSPSEHPPATGQVAQGLIPQPNLKVFNQIHPTIHDNLYQNVSSQAWYQIYVACDLPPFWTSEYDWQLRLDLRRSTNTMEKTSRWLKLMNRAAKGLPYGREDKAFNPPGCLAARVCKFDDSIVADGITEPCNHCATRKRQDKFRDIDAGRVGHLCWTVSGFFHESLSQDDVEPDVESLLSRRASVDSTASKASKASKGKQAAKAQKEKLLYDASMEFKTVNGKRWKIFLRQTAADQQAAEARQTAEEAEEVAGE